MVTDGQQTERDHRVVNPSGWHSQAALGWDPFLLADRVERTNRSPGPSAVSAHQVISVSPIVTLVEKVPVMSEIPAGNGGHREQGGQLGISE